MSRCRQIVLAKMSKHLHGNNIRQHKLEVIPAHEFLSLLQNSNYSSYIPLNKAQSREKNTVRGRCADGFHMLCQLVALSPLFFCLIQVIPFVVDTCQTQKCFTGHPLWWIARQIDDTPVGLGCQWQLVVYLLDLTKI